MSTVRDTVSVHNIVWQYELIYCIRKMLLVLYVVMSSYWIGTLLVEGMIYMPMHIFICPCKQTVWSGEMTNLLEQTAWCRECEMRHTVSNFLSMHINSTAVWLWCLYLTIRQRVWVVYKYEQIFNEAKWVDYHS